MRDIKRLKRILDLVDELWHYYPDQRLGQFLENYVFGHHSGRICCIFHFEDDNVEQRLKQALIDIKKNRVREHYDIKK